MNRRNIKTRRGTAARPSRIGVLAAATLLALALVPGGAAAKSEEVATAPSGVAFGVRLDQG